MEKTMLLFGRNLLKEALEQNLNVKKIYFQGPNDKDFVQSLLKKSSGISLSPQFPQSRLKDASHQGVAFELDHQFYLDELPADFEDQFPRILLCNHLEDVQNLGAISRSAAAFDFGLVVHESRRSAQLTEAAIRVSAGFAFRLKFFEVANLTPFLISLGKRGYELAGLVSGGDSLDLYEWKPQGPVALVLGAEHSGISEPVKKQLDFKLRIPMFEGVDSLNASQAASIAISWIYSCRSR